MDSSANQSSPSVFDNVSTKRLAQQRLVQRSPDMDFEDDDELPQSEEIDCTSTQSNLYTQIHTEPSQFDPDENPIPVSILNHHHRRRHHQHIIYFLFFFELANSANSTGSRARTRA